MKIENSKLKISDNRGFISEILLVLVVLVFLRYFVDIDIIGYLEMPLAKAIEWLKNVIK
jgi:hypothetical protein